MFLQVILKVILIDLINYTHLLVPATNTSSMPQDIQHILDLAKVNNLKLNNSKSQEMIVYLPRRRKYFSYQ